MAVLSCMAMYADAVGTWETGMQFAVRLPQPLTAATLSYKVKFEKGYDWTRGGKLPGLCDEGVSSEHVPYTAPLQRFSTSFQCGACELLGSRLWDSPATVSDGVFNFV